MLDEELEDHLDYAGFNGIQLVVTICALCLISRHIRVPVERLSSDDDSSIGLVKAPSAGSLQNERLLELCEGSQHVDLQPAKWAVIDAGEAVENRSNLQRFELLEDNALIGQIPRKAIRGIEQHSFKCFLLRIITKPVEFRPRQEFSRVAIVDVLANNRILLLSSELP